MSKNFKDEALNLEEKDFASRFRIVVEKAGGFSALSRSVGISPASVTNYLKGQKPKIDVAIKIARSCGVDPAWLILGIDENKTEESLSVPLKVDGLPESELIQIPLFNIEASAGNGLIPSEWEHAEMVPISRDFIHQLLGMVPKSVFMMRVQGDSMAPTIYSRDTLFVDYAPRRLTQGIYVMRAGETTLVKRLGVKDPWTYSIISDNPVYPSFDIPMEKTCWGNANTEADLRIVGRVVGVFHDFD